MDADERVCSCCGSPPGGGIFCSACGRNLGAVERLPTRGESQGGRPASVGGDAAAGSLAVRCANATATFLVKMREADNPGATKMPMAKSSTSGEQVQRTVGCCGRWTARTSMSRVATSRDWS